MTMNDTQSRLLSMYKDIARILDAHGIRYYLCYGSAIGAVRHDGFIPWDDDMDIWVWDEDLPEIKRLLQEELDSEHYYYHDSRADTHPHVIYRDEDLEDELRDKTVPFIDLFPIVAYPEGRFRQALSNMMIWGVHISVTVLDHVGPLWLYRGMLWIPRMFRKAASALVEDGSDLRTIYTTEFRNEIFHTGCFGKPVAHVFEDTTCYLAERNDELLTHIFGDYMTPPPEDKRTGAKGFPLSALKDYILDERARDDRCPSMDEEASRRDQSGRRSRRGRDDRRDRDGECSMHGRRPSGGAGPRRFRSRIRLHLRADDRLREGTRPGGPRHRLRGVDRCDDRRRR